MDRQPSKIILANLYKSFRQPDKTKLEVLSDLSMEVEKGRIIAITGASGSGKSTLLHIMGGLDTPDSGSVYIDDADLSALSSKELNLYRNQKVGFVFQFHYMMPELTVLENVAFPRLLSEFDKPAAFRRAEKLLEEVDLLDKRRHMPWQLSGGERQRAAIARGLMNNPDILLADEPTGNLDWKTGERVFNLFRHMLRERGLTSIIVTHNEQLAELADQRFHLQEGKLHTY